MSLFADSGYSIEVVGPNGFYRSFTGRSAAFPIAVRASYERQGAGLSGNLEVQLRNRSGKSLSIAMKDNSYRSEATTRTIKAGEEARIVLDFEKNHGWYDFTVKADGSDHEARYAGRVETGKPSFSDPLMGGVELRSNPS